MREYMFEVSTILKAALDGDEEKARAYGNQLANRLDAVEPEEAQHLRQILNGTARMVKLV